MYTQTVYTGELIQLRYMNTDNTSHQIFCIVHLRHVTSRDEKIFECLYSEARVEQVNILVIIVSMFSSVIIMIITRAGN